MKTLIADDIAEDRQFLRYNLERRGCEIIEAKDGREGLELAAIHKPDLIISDAFMPGMDGFQFLKEVKKSEALKIIPFIFYSAVYTGYDEEKLAISLGAEAFIVKPKEPEEFWYELSAILEKCRIRNVTKPQKELIRDEEEYLERYSHIVAVKLEEKVKELADEINRRGQTEKMLRDSEERYRLLFQHSPIGIFHYDIDLYITDCNDRFIEILQSSRERLLGLDMKTLKDQSVLPSLCKAIEGKEGYYEGFYRATTGPAEIWVLMRTAPILDQDGNVQGGVGIVEDITERKKAEDMLTERETRLRTILALEPECVKLLSFDGTVLEMNPAGLAMIEAESAEQVVGKSVLRIIDPRYRTVFKSLIERVFQGESDTLEFEIIGLKGRHRWMETHAVPLREEDGRVGALLGITRDISERKRADEELRESEERLRIIFETSQAGIILVDFQGKITFANGRMAEMFGCTLPELIGTPYPEHLHALEKTIGDKKMRQLIAGEIDHVSTERHYVRKDGSDFWGYLSGRRLEGPDGKLRALVGIVADISERKKMEERIFQITRDWEDTFNSITDMITIHDKDFNIIHSNKAAEKILGLSFLEKTEDAKCFKYYHGTKKPPEGCPSCDCLQTGKAATFELFEPHLNMFIEIRAIPRFDSNNQLIGLIHVVRDISERKKTEEYIKRQLERMTALRSIDMAISSTLDLRVTIHILLEQVVTQLKVDAANILLLDSHTMFLNFAAGRGFRSKAVEKTHIRLGQGFAGQAAMQYKAISIPNLSEGGEALTAALKDEGFRAYFAVPLIAKGQIKGVLEIFHRTPLDPDPEWLSFLELLGGQAAIAVDNVSLFDTLQRSHAELVMAYDTTIEGWSRALDYRDKETEGHSQRVTEIVVRIAKDMGIHDDELVHVRRGALLHDIGKLGVPDDILLKPGKLTDEEWAIMKKHPVIAFELLSPISFLRSAIDIPYCHHEKWDGTGYPRGLRGEQIPLAARIFAVVDVWDALRSDRPYRPAWTEERAFEHISTSAGSHFDPEVVEVFLKFLKKSQ